MLLFQPGWAVSKALVSCKQRVPAGLYTCGRISMASNQLGFKSSSDAKATSSPSSPSSPFVNIGLIRWEKIRSDWKKPSGNGKGGRPKSEVVSKAVDIEDIVDRLFSQSGNGVLPEPIPLGQMIDILTDYWENETEY